MTRKTFKMGDIIKGKSNFYTVTSDKMKKAIVEELEDISMNIKIIDHKNKEYIGKRFWVNNNNKDFSLFFDKDFKPGDIIKGKENNGYGLLNDNLLKAEVINVFEDDLMEIKVLSHIFENHSWKAVVENSKSKFELIEKENITMDMELKDLKNGTIVEYRNGWKRVYMDEKLYEMEFDNKIFSNECSNIHYHNNLKARGNKNLDIMKIYKDFRGELIWERKEEEKEKKIDWSKVKVDTLLKVKFFGSDKEVFRYFAKYENGLIYVWFDGKTSITAEDKYDIAGVHSAKLFKK